MPLSCYVPSQIIPKSRIVHLADKQILKRHIMSYPKIIVSKNPPGGGGGKGPARPTLSQGLRRADCDHEKVTHRPFVQGRSLTDLLSKAGHSPPFCPRQVTHRPFVQGSQSPTFCPRQAVKKYDYRDSHFILDTKPHSIPLLGGGLRGICQKQKHSTKTKQNTTHTRTQQTRWCARARAYTQLVAWGY